MARPRIPAPRFITLTLLASLGPCAVFAYLAASGRLDGGTAMAGALVCMAALGLMVRYGLGDVYRILHFSESLARDGEGGSVPGSMTGLFPEFSEAVAKIREAWERDRGQLDARASSAEMLLENLPHPLIILDTDRQIMRTTQGANDLFAELSVGSDLSSVIRNPELLASVDRVLAGERDSELVEFDMHFPADKSLTAQIQSLPGPRADGSAAVVAFYDVTEIRLVQSMRSDFVANASHELRTPLAVLNGCIQTLKGPARGDAEGTEKFLGMMEGHTSRMTSLIEDLLSLSRIELNKNTPPSDKVDVNEALSTVVTTLEVPAAERHIDVVVEPGFGEQIITGDRVEIVQLLRNLVENAIKYSDEKSEVRIITRESRGPRGRNEGEYLEIAVIDQGAGIAAEHLPRLTERFYRVDTARSREMGGTGLGLAIVKHIVNRHRGTLEIDSVEGQGSTFRVFLPITRPSAAPL
ncbi:MAG: ATP-binding protein [Alphaproteobacteria bacterium]